MARRNMFDIINNDFDFDLEFARIYNWFESEIIYNDFSAFDSFYNIEEFADIFTLLSWKQRKGFNCTDDLLEKLGLYYEIYSSWDYDDKITWFEYALNLIYISVNYIQKNSLYGRVYDNKATEILKDIIHCLENVGLEVKTYPEEEQIIIVQKNKAATSVTELVSDNLARDVFEYNRFNMKGEIDEKREIIIKIAREYEGFEKELKSINKELGDNLGFMLNKFHIRHNNEKDLYKDPHCKKFFDLSKEEQEAWYDKTYDLLLLAFLEKDAKEIHKELDEFKKV